MDAHTCPSCGARLMSFSEFFRSVGPSTRANCKGCGVALRRSGGVWLVLAIAAVLFGALAIWLARAEWPPLQILLVMIVALPVWIVAVKFIGWTAVPWKVVQTT